MKHLPGLSVPIGIAVLATFISLHYGGPQLLYALLMGLSLNFVYDKPGFAPGVDFAARSFLRVGVALLGARITVGQVSGLGLSTLLLIAFAVVLTIVSGALLARVLRRPTSEGVLSGSAVGICGASAALAVASVLPVGKRTERFTLMTVVGVTLLSTFAMVFYPLLTQLIRLEPVQAGIFLGGTIHDVAQVVAAGMLLGDDAGETATIIKLFRVMMLMPVVVLVSLAFRHQVAGVGDSAKRPPLLPAFLVGFIALVLLSSGGYLPTAVVNVADWASRELLVVAIAAAGLKTRLADLATLGWQPVLMLVTETALLAIIVIVGILALGLPV